MKRKALCLATVLLTGCTHVEPAPPKRAHELVAIAGAPAPVLEAVLNALKPQVQDAELEDASVLWTPLVLPNEQALIAQWPATLQADWHNALERCPPDSDDLALKILCGTLIRQVLWNRVLELRQARASTNVTWQPESGGTMRVIVEHIEANAMFEVRLEESVPLPQSEVSTLKLLRALPGARCNRPYIPTTSIETAIGAANSKESAYAHVGGCREPKPDAAPSALPAQPASVMRAAPPAPARPVYNSNLDTTATPASMGPLILLAACASRPGRLRIDDSVAPSFSVMLIERWTTANAGVPGTLECELNGEDERRAGAGGLPITVNTYVLTCGKHSVKTAVVTQNEGWAERASQKLLSALAAELCP